MREERIERVIGEDGYPVDVISHFKNGKLVDNYDGSTIKKIMYDWSDREIEISHYHSSGMLMPDIFGIAIYKTEYLSNTEYEEHFLGPDNSPVENLDGATKISYKLDDLGNIVETSFYGINGKPVKDSDGVSTYLTEYDEMENISEERYLNSEGLLIESLNRWAITKFKYDKFDRLIENKGYGLDLKLKEDVNRVAIYEYDYDHFGNISEIRHFSKDRILREDKFGYAIHRKSYNEFGKIIESKCCGIEGKLKLNIDGYAICTSKFDEIGKIIEIRYSDRAGEAIDCFMGYTRIKYEYDNEKTLAITSFYNTRRVLVYRDSTGNNPKLSDPWEGV